MIKKLKIIFSIIILFTSINFTYAENKCEIKNFQFNDIFEKNPELNYHDIFYKIINPKFGIFTKKVDVNAEPVHIKGLSTGEVDKDNRKKGQKQFNYVVDTLKSISLCDIKSSLENYNSAVNLLKYTYREDLIKFVNMQYDFLGIYISFLNGNFDESIKIAKNNYSTIGFELNMGLIDNGDIPEYKKMYNEFTFLENYITKIKNLKTSDEYSGKQYYLSKLNIIESWKNQNFGCSEYLSNGECKTKFNGKKDIVVAVIDDGINLNHPDITNKIWTNQNEIPGNKIDDDKNGYIDDFNGWNFYYNDNNTIPMGEHGTAVAGVIGAEKDNGIGMAGIISNAKIMSLGVFSETGTTETERILKAINYAIDNKADIINMSLAGTQFIFTQEYNQILEKAYEKNIPIIVSAGNGDILSSQTNGVNTTINKLSPVCNEYYSFLGKNNKKIVFGVGSLQENGEKSKWSNYGDCVDFWTYGENIFSLSILDEESEYGKEYNKFNGTSFSAPILAGIIGLGINKVGNVKVDLIYDALEKSMVTLLLSKNGEKILNANLFLDNLITLSNEEVKKQEQIKKEESMKKIQELIKQKSEDKKKKLEEQEKAKQSEENKKDDNFQIVLDFVKSKYLEIIFIFVIIIMGFFLVRKNGKA
ncbi:MAG: S8 family serine peptidase [Candidatus Gracilibacteria bacterium]|nr:S8 family serine peptidase [Candidatus Gracilibacteria bacterium]